jgi:hypothetical protein
MSQPCTICTHAKRRAIDEELVAGAPNRRIASRYHVIETSVRRHRQRHLPEKMVKAQEAEDVRQAIDVVAQLKAVNAACWRVLTDARAAGDAGTVLRAADRIGRQLELQAKLLELIDERPVVNIVLSDEWIGLRGRLLAALEAYPDARLALAESLNGHAG